MLAQGMFIVAFTLSVTLVLGGWLTSYLCRAWWSGLVVVFGLGMAVTTYPLSFGNAPEWALDSAWLVLKISSLAILATLTAITVKQWIWGLVVGLVVIIMATARKQSRNIRSRLTSTAEMPAIAAD